MPMAKLTTKQVIDDLPHPKQGQTLYWCTDLRGFGVRVGARDKTFIVQRHVSGKDRRITLGRYGEISLQKARQDAEQLNGEMVGGTDPVARKRDETAGGLTLRQAWEGTYKPYLAKKGRSQATIDDYQFKIDCHMSDWLDQPLINITRDKFETLHTKIGRKHPYMANGVARTLRAIWRRARKKHPHLPESPTAAIDFYEEKGRTNTIKDWPAWWASIQQIASAVRRDFYTWLMLSGCRAGESMMMEVVNVDLDNAIVKYPITKTDAFEIPLSSFMVDLLRKRIAENGKDCRWVFPSITSKSGHLEEEKLNASEKKLFKQHWSPHTLRHSWITIADQKVKVSDTHQRALVNHKPKRAKSNDAHAGYIHVDVEDLRAPQQAMTDYLLQQIKLTPSKRGRKDNVVEFKRELER